MEVDLGRMIVEEGVIPVAETGDPPVSRIWTYQTFFRADTPRRGIRVSSAKRQLENACVKLSVHFGDNNVSLIQVEVYKPIDRDSDLPDDFEDDLERRLLKDTPQIDGLQPNTLAFQTCIREFLGEFRKEYNRRRDPVPKPKAVRV